MLEEKDVVELQLAREKAPALYAHLEVLLEARHWGARERRMLEELEAAVALIESERTRSLWSQLQSVLSKDDPLYRCLERAVALNGQPCWELWVLERALKRLGLETEGDI